MGYQELVLSLITRKLTEIIFVYFYMLTFFFNLLSGPSLPYCCPCCPILVERRETKALGI